jgi:hypothetical protein
MAPRSSLRILGGPLDGKELVLEGAPGELLIGADARCHLCIELPGVSPIHARLRRDAGGTAVYDEGGARGVFVNDDPVRGSAALRSGDILWLGSPGGAQSVMIQCRLTPVAAFAPAATSASRQRLRPAPDGRCRTGTLPEVAPLSSPVCCDHGRASSAPDDFYGSGWPVRPADHRRPDRSSCTPRSRWLTPPAPAGDDFHRRRKVPASVAPASQPSAALATATFRPRWSIGAGRNATRLTRCAGCPSLQPLGLGRPGGSCPARWPARLRRNLQQRRQRQAKKRKRAPARRRRGRAQPVVTPCRRARGGPPVRRSTPVARYAACRRRIARAGRLVARRFRTRRGSA